MRLITNKNKENDRMKKVLIDQGINTHVYIASAFFSESDVTLNMTNRNCTIMLIVRLDFGTSPDALRDILGNPKIDIRFFTGTNFHPKFYIFGTRTAYVGSANFTKKGLTTNNEVTIEFDSEEPIFDELYSVFWDYWNQAEVLTSEKLEIFASIINECKNPEPFRAIKNKIGSVEFDNVNRPKDISSSEEKYITNFRKQYQLYISKFNQLKEIYKGTGIRRYPHIPLRIEVDRFLWWIREIYIKGDSYKDTPIKTLLEIETCVLPFINDFSISSNSYLDNTAAPHYLDISIGFSSQEKIDHLEYKDLFILLLNVYAFHDSSRYHNGGREQMRIDFENNNTLPKIKNTLKYLLYGKEEYEKRIFKCLYLEEYKLQGFGEHSLKELYGLVNNNDIPICNGRTLKSMEWLGFGKL